MDTVCLQCGDKGFTNAFVYCAKCLKYAVHRYCLDVIPENFDEFVRWVCEDCKVELQNHSVAHKSDGTPCLASDPPSAKIIEGITGVGTKEDDMVAVQTEEHVYEDCPLQSHDACTKVNLVECAASPSKSSPMKFKGMNDRHVILSAVVESDRCLEISSKELEQEKAEDNLVQQVKLSDIFSLKPNMKKNQCKITKSTSKKDQHRLGNTSSKQPDGECTNLGISKHAKLTSDNPLPCKLKENKISKQRDRWHLSQQPYESDIEPGTAEHHMLSCNRSLQSSKKEKTAVSSEAILEERRHGSDATPPLKKNKGLCLGNHFAGTRTERRGICPSSDHEEKRKLEVGEEFPKDKNIPSMLDFPTYAQPVIKPIWRGSFNIRGGKHAVLVELTGHISSKACQKAYEEASLFQPVLHLEMLPQSDVWPKSFEISEPKDENIAVYFFPSDISERGYDQLVGEMKDKESALKGFVKNADLLVYTSTVLPLLYWRFKRKNYLWGVFRAKQLLPSHQKELEDNGQFYAPPGVVL